MEETSQRKNWLVWGVVGVLLVSVVVGGTWVYLRGRERAQRAGPLQEGEDTSAYPTVAVSELKARFEPVEWSVSEVTADEVVLTSTDPSTQIPMEYRLIKEMVQGGPFAFREGQRVKLEFAANGMVIPHLLD